MRMCSRMHGSADRPSDRTSFSAFEICWKMHMFDRFMVERSFWLFRLVKLCTGCEWKLICVRNFSLMWFLDWSNFCRKPISTVVRFQPCDRTFVCLAGTRAPPIVRHNALCICLELLLATFHIEYVSKNRHPSAPLCRQPRLNRKQATTTTTTMTMRTTITKAAETTTKTMITTTR